MKTLLTAVFVTAAILPTPHPTATAEPTSTSDLSGSTGARELPPVFRGEIVRLDRNLRQRMTGSSWHPGCPVPLRDLRLLKLRVRNFENEVKRGRLVVHKTAASRMVNVFRRLFEAGFRIRRMQLVDAFGADDHRSMNADNTSAFNCREVAGRPGVWSRHAFGRAIDVNPVENPYVFGSHVSPPKGRPFAVRSPRRRGMVNEGGQVVRILASIGWEWGGNWYGAKDYQHFSASGD
ncbi:MAG: M15 family metallopeptidase [Solirubrobacterales bacterium]|nr:M15 family metallopeptidase [Solirubrobacterales bacterium]HMT05741.1 M15 family metallopeptidase [Solirubrobacterales bacterium]